MKMKRSDTVEKIIQEDINNRKGYVGDENICEQKGGSQYESRRKG